MSLRYLSVSDKGAVHRSVGQRSEVSVHLLDDQPVDGAAVRIYPRYKGILDRRLLPV